MATTTQLSGRAAAAGRAALTARLPSALTALREGLVLMLQAGVSVLVPFLGAAFTGAVVGSMFGSLDNGVLVGVVAGIGMGVCLALWFARRGAGWARARLERRYGIRLRPERAVRQPLEQDGRGHWWTGYSYHRDHTVARVFQYIQWLVRDRETRREVSWLAINPLATVAIIGPPGALVVGGVLFALSSLVDVRTYGSAPSWPLVNYLISSVIGGAIALVGLLVMPAAVRGHADVALRALGRGDKPSHAQLSRRVAELTVTRADAVGAQAAELRRIERDLHDGAQARLVAIGLTLGTIEHLLETDPVAARALLAEARQSSARALQELRDLVRGIHPPVLAERGLADAVRELGLGSQIPTEVTVSLPGRPEASMETAVYFCVSELLANVAKHSGAGQVWVDILFRAECLRVTVTDDGRGGACLEGGGGLRGIERRLGTFDGVISLSSPLGGPTTITLELPCASSSLRTSTSFEKA